LAVAAAVVLVILKIRSSGRPDGPEADYDDRENDWDSPDGGDYVPAPPRTRPIFRILAWASPAIPVLIIIVFCGIWMITVQPGKPNAWDANTARAVGSAMSVAQLIGTALAAVALAGMRCRRGMSVILPGAILGFVLNVPCLVVTVMGTAFFGQKGPMV
jgi:hypothetical protein